MFDFILSFPFIVGLSLGALAGAFIGLGLGRRSERANEAYDRIRAEAKIREQQLRDQIERLRASGKSE